MAVPDPFFIGLVGPAGVGKDTAAAHLVAAHGFVRYGFADPISEMVQTLLAGCRQDFAYIRERGQKEQPIPGLGVSYRELAQTVGTECGRHLHPDLWLRVAELRLGLPHAPVHDRIVISDVRFPNELQWLRRRGALIVRVLRSTAAVRPHESEAHSASLQADSDLYNSSSKSWLYHQIDYLMHQHASRVAA